MFIQNKWCSKMKKTNLIVLVNAAKADQIKKAFPDHHVYNDAHFFSILNGDEYFFGKKYGYDDIRDMCEMIELMAEKHQLLIHTFNPLIINLLEAYAPDEANDGKLGFSMPLSEKRFALLNNEGEFVPLLKIPEFARKLDILCVGEAVCDSIISNYM